VLLFPAAMIQSVALVTRLWIGQSEVRIPEGARGFSLLQRCPDQFWGPSNHQLNREWGSFAGGWVARPWSWLLISVWCWC